MKVIELDSLAHALQDQLLGAAHEAIVITQHERPILVVRSLLDDVADELIAQYPAFLESIQKARRQKMQGQVRRLADLRQKYSISRPQRSRQVMDLPRALRSTEYEITILKFRCHSLLVEQSG